MAERLGRQIPTKCLYLNYSKTHGSEAVDLYEKTNRIAMEWQKLLLDQILGVNEEGLYVHTRFGYAVSRRNGKNEVASIRELYGLKLGEKGLHTAHRTTTSSTAAYRLAELLDDLGYKEVQRVDKSKKYEKSYSFAKQFGLERIVLLDTGGKVDFRTRSSKGGLGEGFDYLIIDEAQEYTNDQESALKYVVSSSQNPQIIFCGTPPTTESSGTVFVDMRESILQGESEDSGWAEWSVDVLSDVHDRELWYMTNPSLGVILTERKIAAEISNDDLDFNIQRLGFWYKYNQKSAISAQEWANIQIDNKPQFTGKLFVGIKYGRDNTNVGVSIAVKTVDRGIFIESIDCKPIREGNDWILAFLGQIDLGKAVVDGANGQTILEKDIADARMKIKPIIPTVAEYIEANSMFTQAIGTNGLCHNGQPSLVEVVTNCKKRAIGSHGGFGYESMKEGADIVLLDSAILAFWACATYKDKKPQVVGY